MKTIALAFAGLATILGLLLAAAPAHAIPRTFVAGTGSGGVCTRAAPCATFQAAHNATDAGGEVNCLDAGSFGFVTITKSITIDCAGAAASIGPASTGVQINTPDVVVSLRNLTIKGGAPRPVPELTSAAGPRCSSKTAPSLA